MKDFFSSINWRIPRAMYFLYMFCINVVTVLSSFALPYSDVIFKFFYFWLSFLVFIMSIFITIKRFNDLNRSWWSILWLLVPFVNIYYAFILYLKKWTTWPNKYWDDPLKKELSSNQISTEYKLNIDPTIVKK